jgi:hypothetical protein
MSIFNSVINEPSIAPFVATVKGYVDTLGIAVYIGLIAVCLFVGLYGRRCSGLVRVSLLFAIGFVAAVYWVCPLVAKYAPQIPGYYIGLAAGLFLAVISRLIYNGVYIGAIGFDVYNILFNGMMFESVTAMTKGNLPVSVGVACAAVLFALIIRKYLEMLITAAGAGIGIAFFVSQMFDYAAKMNMKPVTAMLVVGAVLTLPMFIYQFRHRRWF